MTFPSLSDLKSVNEEVNALPYKSDPPDFDDWRPIGLDGGDCDSYAVAKLQKLSALGWPVEKLRLATCYAETGVYHAVLAVDTDEGQLVLDNRYPWPMTLDDLHVKGYKPDTIQAHGGSRYDWREWVWKSA